MKANFLRWPSTVWLVPVLVIVYTATTFVVAEEASLRCSRCPAICTSAHTYQLSCHNACRSVSPRLTQVRCEGNRCLCTEPATTTTLAPSTTTKKKSFFG